ncbi:WD40 repeat domain-containing protein [Nocardia fluminea]|uniref:WD40 repeat domain-containing protein n=1 Tax=Nocardia fluminea TaxID=134984 RepID=UPI00367326F8
MSKVSYGTIAGWFAGTTLPQYGNPTFLAVLKVCGVEDPAEIEAWKDAVQRIRRTLKAAPLSGSSPYRGLREFEEDNAGDFYGRDDLAGELVQSVKDGLDGVDSPVVVVVGVSGSGKTSLLRAGLLAQMPNAVRITPTAEPDNELQSALHLLDGSDSEQQILVIDQCEELWTLRPQDSTHRSRDRFLDRLSKWVDAPDHVLIVGLRADFFGRAMDVPLFQKGLDEDVQIRVTSMSVAQLTDVIVEPAKTRNATVSQILIDTLVEEMHATDSASDAGVLPMLSHVLHETWNTATVGGENNTRELTYEDYLSTGGIRGAVEKSADEVCKSLTAPQQLIAQRVMIRSVVVSDESLARRRVAHSELEWRDSDAEDVQYVIDRFVKARLLTSSETSVQISHESLLRRWPRLGKWIEDDRVSIMRHRRFGHEAQQWNDHDRDPDYLISRGRTEEYKEWAADKVKRWDLNTLEQDYLAANTAFYQEQDRLEQRRIEVLERANTTLKRSGRNLIFAVVAIALVAVLAAVLAIQARDSSRLARRTADELVLRQAALQWQLLRQSDPALAQQVALAGYQVSPTAAVTRSALLDSTAVSTPVRTFTVSGSIASAVSPDGTLLAVANSDSNVRIFRTDTPGRAPIATFAVSLGNLYALVFRPNTSQLAVGGAQGAQLWDLARVESPIRLPELPGVRGRVENVAWAPAGGELAVTGDSGVTRWAVNPDGTATPAAPALPSTNIAGVRSAATAVAYSPDGKLIATGGRNATLQIWDRRSAGSEPVAQLPMNPAWLVLDLAFDANSSKLAVGTTHTEALIVDVGDLRNPTIVQRAGGFTSYVNTVAFDAAGTTLAAGSSDNSVGIFDVGADAVTSARQILPGPSIVTSVNVFDKQLVTASVDGYIRTWQLPGPLTPMPLGSRTITLTADTAANLMIVGSRRSSQDPTADSQPLFDITDPHNLREVSALLFNPPDQSSGVATISPDGRTAAAGTKAGSLYIWDIADPENPRSAAPPVTTATSGAVAAMVFTPDSRYLLAAGADDTNDITVLDRGDSAQPKTLAPIEAGDRIQLLSVSPDGKYLAASTANSVRLWDISKGPHNARLIDEDLSFGDNVSAVRFATGDLLAAGSSDATVRLYRASDAALTELAHLDGPRGQIQSLSFDPAATQLAAGTGDGQVWLWDISKPEHPTEKATLLAYGKRVNDVVFGADGASLIAAGDDSNLRSWRTDADHAVKMLCDRPASLFTEDEWDRYLTDTPYRAPCS